MKSKNYLKFYRVIKYWTLAKYQLSNAELDLLFFLYDEGYFNKGRIAGFVKVMPWNYARFLKMIDAGWIDRIKSKEDVPHRFRYKTSMKTNRMLSFFYQKLDGQPISEEKQWNPLMRDNVKYTDKVYRNMIIDMNAEREKLRGGHRFKKKDSDK